MQSRPERWAWLLTVPEPPPCPPGWQTGPPDFVVIGAQKAGTTRWFWLIEKHPDVHHLPRHRQELHFFDRFYTGWPGPDEIARYHAHFPRPPGGLSGEKTPEYMVDHWVPRMLSEAAPDARLIALLRDPIDRFVSGRTHTRNVDWPDERRIVGDEFQMGLYADLLARYLDWFPREQLLILQHERCVRDAEQELRRTFAFLGLRPHEVKERKLDKVRHATKTSKLELEPHRRELLVQLYARDIERLLALVPDLDLTLWPNFAHLTPG